MTNNIQYWKYTSDDFLNEFINYNNFMENYLIRNYFRNRVLDISESEIKNFNEENLLKYSKQTYEVTTFYPQSFRASFFSQIFSILEYELKNICAIYHIEAKTQFSINDLKGNSEIEKAKLFLKKTAKIDFATLEPEWAYLNTIRKIRNLFIHHQGELSPGHNDWKSIRQFITANKGKIGYGNSAEYLDCVDFETQFPKDYVFVIDISDDRLNIELIYCVKEFLKKLALKLDN